MGRGDDAPFRPGEPPAGAFDFFLPNDKRCRRGLSPSVSDDRLKKDAAVTG